MQDKVNKWMLWGLAACSGILLVLCLIGCGHT